MVDAWGYKCVRYQGPLYPFRHHQRLPQKGVLHMRVLEGDHWYLFAWYQGQGYKLVAMGRGGRDSIVQVTLPARWRYMMPLKRREGLGRMPSLPAMVEPELLKKKWPAVAEFVVATQFEDGTGRLPAELKFGPKGGGWQVTLYDVEQAARLSAMAPSLEAALSLLEQLLGVEEAPWEVDNYLVSLKERREKRKKK